MMQTLPRRMPKEWVMMVYFLCWILGRLAMSLTLRLTIGFVKTMAEQLGRQVRG